MSIRRSPPVPKPLFCALLATAVLMASAPADAQRATSPRDAGRRLTAICQKAGHGSTGLKACAQRMSALCRKAGVDPRSARCWQWVLKREDRGALDMRALRR